MSHFPESLGPELARAARTLIEEMMTVRSGESVLITADSGTDLRGVSALQNAAHNAGASVATMTLTPPLPLQGGLADPFLPEPLVAAAGSCDAWIDLCMPYIAGSKVYDAVVTNGRTRYFLGADIGAGGIARIFGRAHLDRVFEVSDTMSDYLAGAAGETCRITTPGGTDVRFTLAETEGLTLAKANKPGGYFVPGTAVLIPVLESVRGTIVCETTFHEYYTLLGEPLRFEVDGTITSVSGGGSELHAMDRALRRAGNGAYGHIVHFSCGFHPGARFTGHSFIEDQRAIGCDAVGLGLPPWVTGGGENHPDCVMSAQSIVVGDELMVENGIFRAPTELVEAAGRLEPLYG